MEQINQLTSYINTDPFLLFFGSFYLVLGLSIFLANKPWHEFIELFVRNEAVSLVMGVLVLPISLFIIVFYNNWETLASTVLMIMGYIGFLKALMLLLRPSWIQSFLNREVAQKFLWLDGLSGIILGLGMLVL